MWGLNPRHILWLKSRIVNCYNKRSFPIVVSYRTIKVSSVSLITPCPINLFIYSYFLCHLVNYIWVNFVVFLHPGIKIKYIIISHFLFFCPSYCIMMLKNSKYIHYSVSHIHYFVYFFIRHRLINYPHCIEFIRGMQVMRDIPHILLQIRSWGEKSSPKWIWKIRIWYNISICYR